MCSSWPRLRSSRCINSRGNRRPSELPIFLISIFTVSSPRAATPKGMLYRCITCPFAAFNVCNTDYLIHPLQLVDHARDHRQPAVPEFRVLGIQPERLEQFGIMLGRGGPQHRQIALGEATLRVFVDRVERVHQAIPERVGVDVEWRMDEMRDVHPEILVARTDIDRGAQAVALPAEPDFADALGGQFAVAPLGMDGALERIERDLPHHGVDHVLDLACEKCLALTGALGLSPS